MKEKMEDPELEDQDEPTHQNTTIPKLRQTIPQVLPFSAAAPTDKSILKCSFSCDPFKDKVCLFRIGKRRCKRSRTCGNFCKTHFKLVEPADGAIAKSFYESMKSMFDTISKTSYDDELERAKAKSMEDYLSDQKRRAESTKLIDPLLKERKLFRVPIVSDGNCQFAAVIHSGKLDISAYALRQEVVCYLRQFPEYFNAFADGFTNFQAYLNHIGGNGKWGDALTLTAMAHLTLRPIHVLTDNFLQPVLTITPLEIIVDCA